MASPSEHKRDRLKGSKKDPCSLLWAKTDESADNDVFNDADSQPARCTPHRSNSQLTRPIFFIDMEAPCQWSSTRCYGRGKSLEDIVPPRIPEALKKEPTPAAKNTGFDWLLETNLVQNPESSFSHRFSLQRVAGLGRGMALEDPSISQLIDLARGEIPVNTSSTRKAASTIRAPGNQQALTGDSIDPETSYPVSKKPALCEDYSEDFPSLPVRKSRSSEPWRSQQTAPLTLSNICDFEDADEPPKGPSSGVSPSSPGAESVSQNSMDTPADLPEFIAPVSVEKETEVNVECSNTFPQWSLSRLSTDEAPQHWETPRPDSVETLPSKSGPDNLGDTSSDTTLKSSPSKPSSDTTLKSSPSKTPTSKESGVTEGEEEVQENTCQAENKDIPAEAGACAPENKPPSKARRKFASGWKLGGAYVLELANVPRGRANELKEMVNIRATIVGFEKKNKKGSFLCRCKFESREACKEVIQDFNGFEAFDGHKALDCYFVDEDETEEDE